MTPKPTTTVVFVLSILYCMTSIRVSMGYNCVARFRLLSSPKRGSSGLRNGFGRSGGSRRKSWFVEMEDGSTCLSRQTREDDEALRNRCIDSVTDNGMMIRRRRRRRRNGMEGISKFGMMKPIPKLLISFASTLFLFASTASAATTTTAASWQLPKLQRQIPIRKTLLYLTLLSIVIYQTINIRATRLRQSIDATSEWGRYADHPSLRFQSLLFLFLRLLPHVCMTKLYTSLRFSHRAHQTRQNGGNLLSSGLLRLGPLYVKIGQILSCRDKLLPPEYIRSLESLQNKVPAKTGRDARLLAYEAFGSKSIFDSVLSSFDDVPLAAASLGQVHRGTLRLNNETVAIKVQRSRLRDMYDKDLALLQRAAMTFDKVAMRVGGAKQDWAQIFSDAEVILYREIDYRSEAENQERFNRDFGLGYGGMPATTTSSHKQEGELLPSAAEWLRSPYVYRDLSSEKILIMEYVPSIKINDQETLERHNVTLDQREYLASCLARAYLRQFCSHKFFSTDPHPGNLGVELRHNNNDDGGDEQFRLPRLVFYDFGQACSLKDDQSKGILEVIEGIMDMDADGCVKAFDRMGVLVEGADLEKVRKKVKNNFDTGKVQVKKQKKWGDVGRRYQVKEGSKILEDSMAINSTLMEHNVTTTMKKNVTQNETTTTTTSTTETKSNKENDEVMQYFTLPAEYAFVARAISQMDGVGKSLDPDFDFISAAAPYIVEVKGAVNYLKDEFRKKVEDVRNRILEWEMKLFRSFGFDAKKYIHK